MQLWLRKSATAVCLITVVLWTTAACANPLASDDEPGESATEAAATGTSQATSTSVAVMPIVTPTPIPAGATVPPPDQPGAEIDGENPDTYIVKEGDTLYGIALRFGVEIRAIIELNGLSDPNDIRAEQELRIPPRQ